MSFVYSYNVICLIKIPSTVNWILHKVFTGAFNVLKKILLYHFAVFKIYLNPVEGNLQNRQLVISVKLKNAL